MRSETYPGTATRSEPHAGTIDLYSKGGMVLRPFGSQRAEAPAPWGKKLKTLGDNMANAMGNGKHVSQTAFSLYRSYGTFTDGLYRVEHRIHVYLERRA
jgi:hypothetical protein